MGEKESAAITRSLYLKTCDDLWKSHIVELQDSISNQLLAVSDHKSAVALYIQRSFQAWDTFWDRVDAEFLPRLLTFRLGQSSPAPTVHVNEEVYTLIRDRSVGMAPATGPTGRY
jgi:preprotein translocase subunit SecA